MLRYGRALALSSTLIATAAMTGLVPGWAGAAPVQDPTAAVTYQQDPAHDGLSLDSAFVAPLTEAWSADLPGTVGYPLIVNGEVILDVADSGYGTSVEARSLDTGDLLWGPTSIRGTYWLGGLAYDNGQVFALNFNGQLTAFDAATGSVNWTEQLPGQYEFTSPPTSVGGTVYVGGAGTGGTLYAVAESDGTVQWTQPVMNGDDSAPAVDSSGVYVSYACEQAYGFGLDGTPLWHHDTSCEGGGGRTAVLHDGKVFVRDDAGATPAVLDESTGAQLGVFASTYAPAFDRDTMVSVESGRLTASDLTAGRTLWSAATSGTSESYVTAPLSANGYIVEGLSDGTVEMRYEQSGVLAWKARVGADIAPPDEHNAVQLTGLAEGDGALAVPAGHTITVFKPVTNPAVSITGGPASGALVRGRARFTFTSAVPNARYECSLDGISAPCTSPHTVRGLSTGRHVFTVSIAYATDGQATSRFVSDTLAPSVHLAPFRPRTVRVPHVVARWRASDSPAGVATYQFRSRRGAIGGRLSGWTAPRTNKKTARTLTLAPGHTVCVAVRARDRVGNTSTWTGPKCVSRVRTG